MADSGQESVLPRNGPWARLASESTLSRLRVLEPSETPEWASLGVNPSQSKLKHGPLTVAALGVDPPDRSVHFHASLLSANEHGLVSEAGPVAQSDLDKLWPLTGKLNTKLLMLVRGEGADHGLVWESGSLDLGTTSALQAIGKDFHQILPDGEGDSALRRLIDDSVNIFNDLELNQRRVDKGMAPINLIWPWGQGHRERVPNLALHRGSVSYVLSRSLRLRGLSRLVGYRNLPRSPLENGLRIDWGRVRIECEQDRTLVLELDGFKQCRDADRPDVAERLFQSFLRSIIEPALEAGPETPVSLRIVSPGEKEPGLGLRFDSRTRLSSSIPFDERALDEPRVPVNTLWDFIESGFGYS